MISNPNQTFKQVRQILLLSLLCFLLLNAYKVQSQGGYTPPKIPAKALKDFDAAVLATKAGHNDAAIQTIVELSLKYPTWTAPKQELSRIYFEEGKKTESISQLEAAIVLDTASQLPQLFYFGEVV